MIPRLFGRERSPFDHKLDTRLLTLGRSDSFTTRDAAEGVLILGGVGSGKTSGSGNSLRKAYLNAGFGGLVLCAKPDEADSWREALKKAGRSGDAVIIDRSGEERFNILDYAAATIAADGFDQNLVVLMERFSEAAKVASGEFSGSDGNKFFSDAASKWLSHAFPLVRVATGNVSLENVYKMILSAPKSPQELSDPEWQKNSLCNAILFAAADKAKNAQDAKGQSEAERVFDEHADFWLTEYPSLASKTRSSIEATVTNIIYPFLAGKLRELFCTDTTVVPDMARQGKIIILDLPALTYGPTGAVAQSIFKYLFGLAVQRQKLSRKARPVFLWMDEVQYFLSASDAELLSTARSAKTCIVAITQDLPTFYAQIGSQQKAVADSIISKFGTKCFHSNTSEETNQAAADLVGKIDIEQRTSTRGGGLNSGGSVNVGGEGSGQGGGSGRNRSDSTSISTRYDYALPPHYFSSELRTGAKKNRYKVDAILVRSGANYKHTGKHWMKATFQQ